MTKHCNSCGYDGDAKDFVPGKRYKDSVRPLCHKCAAKKYKERRKKMMAGYNVMGSNFIRRSPSIDERINLLIRSGNARTKDEALSIINNF